MMAGGATSIIIFGATGDLARRKLLPALFQLWCKGRLPAMFQDRRLGPAGVFR
jgi:glucose-6-phosphate 1-dehydrogenase